MHHPMKSMICLKNCSRLLKTSVGLLLVIFLFVAVKKSVNDTLMSRSDVEVSLEGDDIADEEEEDTTPYNQTLVEMEEDRINSNSSRKHLWKRRFPSAIIIGVQKAGTEALKDFLNLNKKIRIPSVEEVHYFDEHYKRGDAWYKSKMPKSWPEDVTIEKSPNYFNRPKVPARIKSFNPDIKLISIFRNPVDRVVSNWAHTLASGRDNKGSLRKEILFKNNTVKPASNYINKGLYALHMKHWYEYFPKENVLLLDGDAFIKNPIPTLNKVEDFLGLERQISSHNVVYSKRKGFYCKRYTSKIHCQGASKGRHHPSIKKSLIKKMQDFYKPRNKEFIELTGMEFAKIKP